MNEKAVFFFPRCFFFFFTVIWDRIKRHLKQCELFQEKKTTEKYQNIREKIQSTLLKNRLYAAWLRQILIELRMEFSWLVLAGRLDLAGQTYQLWGSQKEVFKFLKIVPRSPEFKQRPTWLDLPSLHFFLDFISNWYENWEIQVKPDINLWKDGLSSFP